MDSIWSGSLMMVVGILGLVPLLYVMMRLLIFRSRLHPFHYLILSKLAADAIEMVLPMMTFSASQLLFGRWLGVQNDPIVGYLALSLQYSSIYTSAAMTVNRLIAVVYTHQYSKWFNKKTTIIWIIACWMIAWIHNAIHLKENCSFIFNAQMRQFTFSDEQCGRTLSLYQDLIYNVTLAIITTLADIYCLLKMTYYRETATNSIFYVLMLASFHIAECFEGITIRFILTVIAWQVYLASTP
ncbi:hypothetical protein OSTOST_03655 [Ostertagia ostertagi]